MKKILIAFALLFISSITSLCLADAGDSFGTAKSINLNQEYSGNLSSSNDIDYYKFTIPQDGNITIKLRHEGLDLSTSTSTYWQGRLYSVNDLDSSYHTISLQGTPNNSSIQEGLSAGTYYLKISDYNYSGAEYHLRVDFEASNYYEKTPNPSASTATVLSLNQEYTANLASSNDVDYFKFNIPQNGNIRITLRHEDLNLSTSSSPYWKGRLYGQSDLNSSYHTISLDGNPNTTNIQEGLSAGTYYLKIITGYKYSGAQYHLKIDYEPSNYYEKTPNGLPSSATVLSLNQEYSANMSSSNDIDYFKFEISQNSDISIELRHEDLDLSASSSTYWSGSLYNANNLSSRFSSISLGGTPNNSSIQESLSVGTYYLKITDYYRYSEAQYYLKISDGRQPQNYTISSSAGTGGHISPSTMTVNDGNTGSFTLTTNTGYGIGSVNGTCGGTLNGNIYTTNAITSNCTIFASFILNGQATLTSPSGEIITNTPTYTWEAVSNATWYYLWVNDTTGTLIKKWYTAEAAGCATGSTCSVSPSSSVTGSGKWWIKGWNAQGDYPWSDAMSFIVPNGGVPSIASLVSPSGEMTTDKPSYTWNAVANATWYYLWVNDSVGTRIKIWRTASESGCANGIGLCTYSTSTVLAKGSGGWWVQTWNSSGYGPWSNKASFNITNNKVPAAATLVAPIGSISRNTLPLLKWNAVQGSTWYYLWLNDGSETLVKEWWSASEAGCASGTGICVAGPLNPVNQLTKDNGAWWVRTWNKAGYGPWSQKASFSRD